MTRWFLRAAIVVAGSGTCLAQTPAAQPFPVARPSASAVQVSAEAAVLLMRTTGQPERRLKVVRRSTFSDGEILVDVQDLGSGETFTLPGKLADRLPRDAGAAPVPTSTKPPVAVAPPPAPPVQQPFVVQPPVAVAPPTQSHLEPLPAPVSALPGQTVWRPVAPPQSQPQPGQQPPTQPGLTPVGSAALPAVAIPAPVPATPPPVGDRWKPIPPPAPTPAPVPPGPMSSRDEHGLVVRGQMPYTPADGEGVARVARPKQIAPTQSDQRPTPLDLLEPLTLRSTELPPPVPPAPGFVRLTRPDDPEPVVQPVQYRVPAGPRHGWTADDTWLAELVRREMQPMADQLAHGSRPSVRVNAALGLADMRYAARPEVKAVLATAARTDPAVLVRTVCVRALAGLGYNDPTYVEFLRRTASGDVPEQLRMAAMFALQAVTPRD